MAEVRPVGADPNTVGESARRQFGAQTLVDNFNERRDVLNIVSRHAAADGKNPKTFGRRYQLDQLSAIVFEIHEDRLFAAAFALEIVNVEIVA